MTGVDFTTYNFTIFIKKKCIKKFNSLCIFRLSNDISLSDH